MMKKDAENGKEGETGKMLRQKKGGRIREGEKCKIVKV